MQASTLISVSLIAVWMAAGAGVAHADTTEATCEVRKDGDKQKGKSGPCTFSQRQGYIDIDLKNGDTIGLSPAGGAGQYRDQHGNKVTRTSAGTQGMSLRWQNGKHVEVTWHGNHHGSRSSEYQRGYDDGLRGDWDQYKHNQEYKDGHAAGEAARRSSHGDGKHSGHSSNRKYGINPLDDGAFEVVSSNPFCTVRFNRHSEPKHYSDDCTPEQKRESYEYAQRNR